MSLTVNVRTLPLWQRLFFAIPVLGWMVRDLLYGPKDTIWYALTTMLSAWGVAILTFGLPGLYIPALAMVPVAFACLILITWA